MSAISPRFSIVIPCYNQGAFLADCLDSVARQTLSPHQIIVVDDGSTDRWTVEQLDRRCKGWIQLVRQNNRGLSAARNAGIRVATGDWILPLDCDDQLTPDALQRYTEAITSSPDVDIWYPDLQHFGLLDSLWISPTFNPWRELSQNHLLCSAAIRRTIFDSGVHYNERMRRGFEDWEFYIHACVEQGFSARPLGHPVFRYRKWGYSMLSSSEEQRAQIIDQLQAERPIFRDDAALLALKRRHAPYFAVATQGPRLPDALETQSFGDFRVVDAQGSVNAREDLSVFQGENFGHSLLVSLSDEGLTEAFREDRFLLDKIATIQEYRDPAIIWLVTEPAASAYPGSVVSWPAPEGARSLGVVISSRHLFEHPDFPRTSRGWVADLAEHVNAHCPRGGLRVIVSRSHSSQEGVDIPFVSESTPPVAEMRRRETRLFLLGLGLSKVFRGVLGPHRHDRLLDNHLVRHVKTGLTTGHFPTALRQLARRPSLLRKSGGSRASTEAPRRRAGPLSPSTRSQPRQRDDAWFVSGTAPRFSRAPSGQSILIATPWIIHGGVDRSVVDLAKGLRAVEPSLRIYVATTESARMTWAQEVLSAVDGVFPVGEYGATDPTAAFCELGERLGIRSLLIANSALACAALPKLRRSLPGLRVIVQAHSFDELPGSTVPLGRAAAAASEYNNLIDAYAAISDRAGRTLCEKLYVSPSKVHTIHLGIDRERFARGSGKRFGGGPLRVLWLGRLSEEKDPLMALEVAAQFKQKHGPQALTIKIVGGGPLAPQLELRRRALGLEDVVELVAPVEDPVPFFANADCLLLTSRYEGIPVVLYEAMAAALPVVAPTANTAIQEVLSERESLLVDPRTPKAFVFALERLLNEAELGPKLSSSIAKLASRYSRERFARETLDLLLPSPEHTLKAS